MEEQEVTILIAEDGDGHFELIKKNLVRAGISNQIIRFRDGSEILDFLFGRADGAKIEPNKAYLLLLDIQMPRVDGVEVLRTIKQDQELKKIPVIMLTITDDASAIQRCHELGCSLYIVKPVEYDRFIDAVQKVGLFLSVIKAPQISETSSAK